MTLRIEVSLVKPSLRISNVKPLNELHWRESYIWAMIWKQFIFMNTRGGLWYFSGRGEGDNRNTVRAKIYFPLAKISPLLKGILFTFMSKLWHGQVWKREMWGPHLKFARRKIILKFKFFGLIQLRRMQHCFTIHCYK